MYTYVTLCLHSRAARDVTIYSVAYINYAPMRIGAEDPWALTELAKAGGPGGGVGGYPPTR